MQPLQPAETDTRGRQSQSRHGPPDLGFEIYKESVIEEVEEEKDDTCPVSPPIALLSQHALMKIIW